MRAVAPPGRGHLDAAERTVRAHLAETPLVPAPELGDGVWLKLETLQPTGSFKIRGALAAMDAAPEDARVVTASAGNHALGIAMAAKLLGRSATVVVPATASRAKIEALRAMDVELVLHGASYDEAEAHALALASAGGTFVSPYNDPWVIAGQGTIGRELDARLHGPKVVVAPLGGGGLASGLVLWAAHAHDDMTLVGVEAEASPAWTAAKAAGGLVEVTVGDTLADGLAGNVEPGSVTWDMVDAGVGILASASEERIAAGMRYLAREHGVVAEGAGAAGILVAPHMTGIGDPVVVVVTGRNVALDAYARVLAS